MEYRMLLAHEKVLSGDEVRIAGEWKKVECKRDMVAGTTLSFRRQESTDLVLPPQQYRTLSLGETIIEGDEIFLGGQWQPSKCVGYDVSSPDSYRRKKRPTTMTHYRAYVKFTVYQPWDCDAENPQHAEDLIWVAAEKLAKLGKLQHTDLDQVVVEDVYRANTPRQSQASQAMGYSGAKYRNTTQQRVGGYTTSDVSQPELPLEQRIVKQLNKDDSITLLEISDTTKYVAEA